MPTITFIDYQSKKENSWMTRQSLKRFTFRVKSGDSIFFFSGFKPFTGKILFNLFRNLKRPKKFNYNVQILLK